MDKLVQEETINKKLNRRETYKARQTPYAYYTKEFDSLDFDSLGEGDRYYLQDFGIFNTDFLEDEFTIRLRNGNGEHFSANEFILLAEIIQEYDLTLVITARAGFQLHDVTSENVIAIWQRLNGSKLTTWQSFGDNIRNIVSDVYDGVGKYAQIAVGSLIAEMNDYILEHPKYVGMLPRRVSIGISGNSANVSSFFANDIYFALAKKEHQYGFNVYMGGKNSEVAKDADIFLLKEEVVAFFQAFVETFYTHGSRFSRSRTRLAYLIEDIGLAKLKELIALAYKKPLHSAGETVLEYAEFQEFEQLKNGRYSFCYQTKFGKLERDEIIKIAQFAKENTLEIRVGIDQNIYLLGLQKPKTTLISPAKSTTVVACAGNLCPYAVWSIKEETAYLPLEKIQEHKIKVGFSGCAKGCGRHRHTDIGLIGLKTNNFGDTEGGTRVFVGAEHFDGKSVARELFSMVPFVHLHQVISLMIILFEQSSYKNFQLYSKHVLNHYSAEFLSLWYLYNLKYNRVKPLLENRSLQTPQAEKALLETSFEDVVFIEDNFKKSANLLAKELWTVAGADHKYKPPIKRVKFR